MMGVAGALASTLGYLGPEQNTLIQMLTAVSSGSLIGAVVANRINVRVLEMIIDAIILLKLEVFWINLQKLTKYTFLKFLTRVTN